MTDKPTHEFGKRRPPPDAPIPSQPTKRSAQVVLLVMGTLAVGAGASALMPRQDCQQQIQPGTATPTDCPSRGSSSGGSGGWSRYSYYSGGSSSGDSSSSRAGSSGSESSSGSVQRGGFGSFAHSFGMHFSGG